MRRALIQPIERITIPPLTPDIATILHPRIPRC
jgi:hypothetical protein